MELVHLGSTGLQISRLCLGCMTYGLPEWREWVLDEAASRPFIRKALDVGTSRGVPPAQVALAWLMSRPGITAPIIGASRPNHLDDAVASLSLILTCEEVAVLEAPYRPRPVVGHE